MENKQLKTNKSVDGYTQEDIKIAFLRSLNECTSVTDVLHLLDKVSPENKEHDEFKLKQ